jgi:hypothetical protein
MTAGSACESNVNKDGSIEFGVGFSVYIAIRFNVVAPFERIFGVYPREFS